MSKDLTAPKKKASRRTPFRLHCNHFAPSVLSGGTGKRAIGNPRSQLMDRPPGKAQEPPENKEAGCRPRVRRHSLREGVPEPGATCPIL